MVALMVNSRGIAKDTVPARDKLNKSRTARGAPPIRGYTLVRIGTVYEADGKTAASGTAARQMPVRWRAGHYRHVPVGPRGTGRKQVYIEAVLVNGAAGGDPTIIPRHIKL